MFVFDVSIHNFVVFERDFSLGRFVIGIFNVGSSSVLMIRFDRTLKRRVIWKTHYARLAGNITAACAGDAYYRKGKEKR